MRALAVLLLACGCSAVCPGEDVKALRAEKASLELSVAAQRERYNDALTATNEMQGVRDTLHRDAVVLQALADGKKVRYILHVSIRQIHYSISLKKQLSDALNEEEFDIMTDKQTYDVSNPGADLFESFRAGSAIFKGSLGSWRIKVLSKRTVVES